jgi:hypothetical protein
MEEKKEKKNRRWIFWLVTSLILVAVLVLIVIATKPMPVALLKEYGIGTLWEEGLQMNECAECHTTEDFHDCTTCHDDHGSVELTGVPFSEVVDFTGDVPDPSFLKINAIIPDQDNVGTHITVLDLLEQQGVEEFVSITFITNDGGSSTVEAQYIDETAMLVPYVDGIRFASEQVHASSWLKGIVKIIVVGKETPLTIDGEATSIGRLLLGDTMRVTIEGTDVMLADDDGNVSHAFVANWVQGAPLSALLAHSDPGEVIITDASGQTVTLTGEEVANAVIAMIYDKVTLVLPDRGRSAWPVNIIEIESH